jgi:DNA invertase Pin-like site-specific DNA recombinase
MKAGKADAIVAVNLDAISSGVADAYYKIGLVKEKGFRLITVDEKEQYLYLYEPPKRETEATA